MSISRLADLAAVRQRLAALTAGLPPAYWLIWWGTLINRLGGFVVPFLTLYLTTQRAISVSQAALIVSLFGAGSFIAQLSGGELTDRLGRRPVLLTSFFITPIFMIALGLARDVALISISTFMVGFFTDLSRPAVGAAIADLVPPQFRTRAYGYNYWAINLGWAVAPVLAGPIARQSYLILFVADALTTAIFGLIVVLGLRETRPLEAQPTARTSLGERVVQLKRAPILLIFSGLTLFLGLVYSQAYVGLPVQMQSHGLGPEPYGVAIALNGLLIILATIPLSNLATNWPRFETVAVGAVLLGLGFGFTALASSLPLFALSVAIWTLGEIVATTVAPTIIADLAPPDLRGVYQGIFGAAWGLAFFAGPLAGGWVYQHLGSHVLWVSCLLMSLIVAYGYYALSAPAKRRRVESQNVGAPS